MDVLTHRLSASKRLASIRNPRTRRVVVGFIHLRIWFPAFPGVVMLADQELILMCRPPEPTLLRHKAAGFAGTFPHGARVSGVVEETPGRLEYEVALYREATTIGSNGNSSESIDEAVPIGAKLQLRARISPESAWSYIKLLEVTVSPDPEQPHFPGSVILVKDGCRNREFASIIPHQPSRYHDRKNEVFIDFEAFLLSSMRDRSTLWIHSQIKACMDSQDCQPDFCLDLFEPAGHGKRKRTIREIKQYVDKYGQKSSQLIKLYNESTPTTNFKDNIEYSVIMQDYSYEHVRSNLEKNCSNFLYITVVLGVLVFFSVLIIFYLASRLQSFSNSASIQNNLTDNITMKSSSKYYNVMPIPAYTGRSIRQ
ncbi:uncharacterized protein LOC131675635 [Phymastichus coffea]|uniref:uncharacterized protein LOC131675635 n=1 Tax=Phymastichus coffea TaxID=108790 RepID=UPI00273B3066|nr:uncharacterized protein LOC131675635 [Phymastichus coffea]